MAAYNYELMYRAGEQNGNADGMSRLPVEASPEDEEQVQTQVYMVDLSHAPVTADRVRRETERDPSLTRVKEFFDGGMAR